MRTKTCMQRVYSRRLGRVINARRDHEVPSEDAQGCSGGYSRCIHCGQSVYVGQGYCSPYALQVLEHEMARNDKIGC